MRYYMMALIISLLSTGCASLQGKPVDSLNIVGNPWLHCDNGVEGHFVCRKELNPEVIPICQAELNTNGFIVVENVGEYLSIDPQTVQCFLSDERR